MTIGSESVRFTGIRLAALLFVATSVAGQPSTPRHLNKTIERLEAGEVVFGSFASDKSPSGGAFYGGAPVDFVIYDMEHEPLDFVGFRTFLQFMLDRRQIVEKGNIQPEVTPFIRLPFYGRERNHWLIKASARHRRVRYRVPARIQRGRGAIDRERRPLSPPRRRA